MFVGESEDWKTIKVRAQLNLHCIGLGNPKSQLVTIKSYYYKTGILKLCLKMLCFAESTQKGFAIPVSKHLIY